MGRRSRRLARRRRSRETSAVASLPPLRGDSANCSLDSRGTSHSDPDCLQGGRSYSGRHTSLESRPGLRANPVRTSQPRAGTTPGVERDVRTRTNRSSTPQPRGGDARREERGAFSFNDMAHVLAGLSQRDNFRAPTYHGEGDVELFLGQFDDVAVANRWGEQAILLHLRAHLEGSAQACGAGRTRERIEDALRARFGLSQRQAKDRLAHLRRDSKATLHEQAMQIQRLVEIAYPRLARADQEQMSMDHILRSLDNKNIQRHMLTIQPETVVELVQAIDEYMAVGGIDGRQPSVNARVVEAESPHPELSALSKIIEAQGLLLSKLLEKVEALEATRPMSRPPRSAWQAVPSDGCFLCGGPHWKRDCPRGRPSRPQGQPGQRAGPRGRYSPSPSAQQSGNGGGPVRP